MLSFLWGRLRLCCLKNMQKMVYMQMLSLLTRLDNLFLFANARHGVDNEEGLLFHTGIVLTIVYLTTRLLFITRLKYCCTTALRKRMFSEVPISCLPQRMVMSCFLLSCRLLLTMQKKSLPK